MVILLFVVLLTDSVSSSQVVKVGVYPGQGGADYQLYVGTLEILASRRDDSLQSLVTSSVGGVVMGYLRGTFYTGQVTGRHDCRARLWIEKEKLVSANIDCRRKHIVVEEEEAGRYVMQTKKQSATKAGRGETRCDENQQNVCTMYIQTDPFFWKYYRPRHEDDEQTRAAIVRKMVDHIMAANEMFSKYEFSKNSSLQFVLAGLKISRDGECEKYSAGEAMFHQADISISSQDLNGSLYQDYYGTYDDPPWYPEEEPDEVHLNGNNCYEDIEGVANISVDFCKLFYPDQATLYLNMFSSLDHTNYCLAHIWTYRRLEVLGLADTPTLGSPGLSGFCATYDHDCSIGFNTGLISFQHQGQHLPLADSQVGASLLWQVLISFILAGDIHTRVGSQFWSQSRPRSGSLLCSRRKIW